MTNIQSAVEAQRVACKEADRWLPKGKWEGIEHLMSPEALEALLLAVPKVWSPAEILTAPQGRYRSKYPSMGWPNNGDRPLWDILNAITNAETRAKDGKPPVVGMPIAYYGPLSQPESELA